MTNENKTVADMSQAEYDAYLQELHDALTNIADENGCFLQMQGEFLPFMFFLRMNGLMNKTIAPLRYFMNRSEKLLFRHFAVHFPPDLDFSSVPSFGIGHGLYLNALEGVPLEAAIAELKAGEVKFSDSGRPLGQVYYHHCNFEPAWTICCGHSNYNCDVRFWGSYFLREYYCEICTPNQVLQKSIKFVTLSIRFLQDLREIAAGTYTKYDIDGMKSTYNHLVKSLKR